MQSREKLVEFVAWCKKHVTGDEKGQDKIFLDRLFQAFGQPGCLDVGGTPEFRIHKSDEDGGGTAFADYVWKPVVLIEMKKRGTDLQKQLLALNQAVAAKIENGESVTAPGVPKNYPDAKKLVTEDCIKQ